MWDMTLSTHYQITGEIMSYNLLQSTEKSLNIIGLCMQWKCFTSKTKIHLTEQIQIDRFTWIIHIPHCTTPHNIWHRMKKLWNSSVEHYSASTYHKSEKFSNKTIHVLCWKWIHIQHSSLLSKTIFLNSASSITPTQGRVLQLTKKSVWHQTEIIHV